MNEPEIKQLLDTLSEFESQRTILQMDKRKLLEEVKIPAEVEAIVSSGLKLLADVEGSHTPQLQALHAEVAEKLAAIVVPDEIKAALAEIDRKRQEVMDYEAQEKAEIQTEISLTKAEIQASIEASTKDVYTAISGRKIEIEFEFQGKEAAVDANITKLTEQIKAEVKQIGFSVKGTGYHAVYNDARKTWIPKRLDKYVETHPDIKECFTVGEASVALKRI